MALWGPGQYWGALQKWGAIPEEPPSPLELQSPYFVSRLGTHPGSGEELLRPSPMWRHMGVPKTTLTSSDPLEGPTGPARSCPMAELYHSEGTQPAFVRGNACTGFRCRCPRWAPSAPLPAPFDVSAQGRPLETQVLLGVAAAPADIPDSRKEAGVCIHPPPGL